VLAALAPVADVNFVITAAAPVADFERLDPVFEKVMTSFEAK
jgi:hypothetical protein